MRPNLSLLRGGCTLAALVLLAPARALAAQVADAEAAWNQGRYGVARDAYLRTPGPDPASFREEYRRRVIAAWGGRLEPALSDLARARAADPAHLALAAMEAQLLGWAGRFPESLALWDSLIALDPDGPAGLVGKARTLAWEGRDREADSLYALVLVRDPANAGALNGVALLSYWEGRLSDAAGGFERALALDPGDLAARMGLAEVFEAEGRDIEALAQADSAVSLSPASREAAQVRSAILRAVQPAVDLTAGWDGDSDDNSMWWQVVSATTPVADRVRGFGSIGAYEGSSAPAMSATRGTAEFGATYAQRRWELTGAFGLQGLWPDGGVSRTAPTSRLGGRLRTHEDIAIGVQYSHFPFAESATLIGAGIDIDAVDGTLDATLGPGLSLSAGGGAAWFSDGNLRGSAVLAVTKQLPRHFFAGGIVRIGWYENPEPEYFSPDRFSVVEARGGYARAAGGWETRWSGGLGVQQIGPSGNWKLDAHLEGRVGWWFAARNRLEAFAGIANGAYLSATGASRWGTAGLVLRLGL
ncbi:MAG TPA: hypothetical protein VFV65_07390 [Gemmatimonadales bacterium]|nr:hypothetical protein [Gemmatimonadales bacterium]